MGSKYLPEEIMLRTNLVPISVIVCSYIEIFFSSGTRVWRDVE
jgi:hypothetical protein